VRNVVWTAVLAVLLVIASLAIAAASDEDVLAMVVAASSITMAVLSLREEK
jgi:hypothetical protein